MKKYIILGAAILAVIILKNKKKNEKPKETGGNTMLQEDDILDALRNIKEKFGTDKAAMIERLFRLETAHFKSSQWMNARTPGMEIGGGVKTFPYGWSSLYEFSKAYDYDPSDFSTWTHAENKTGKIKTFITFPSVRASFDFVAYLMKKRNWNFGSWFSTKEESQREYVNTLNTIRARYVETL
jgi:hypothetical protein